MENLERIALLIDADNTQIGKLEAIINEISTRGRIVVRRAYGNWRKDSLRKWEGELKRLAIRAVQQFDYTKGKNATDMALVIDTMDLLMKGTYDSFVIVASDSDYTPLAIRLQESGAMVFGVGEKKTPEAFRNACDEFIYIENLDVQSDEDAADNGGNSTGDAGDAGDEKSSRKARLDGLSQIHFMLKQGVEKYGDDDGWTDTSQVTQWIKRAKPDFDPRNFGYRKMIELLQDFPKKYEVRREHADRDGGSVFYRRR